MKKSYKFFVKRALSNPENCITIENNKHITYIDWSDCTPSVLGRIYWKKCINKTVDICRDGDVRSFKIISYIERPSDTAAHDAKVVVRDKETNEEFTLWTRDFKQGDVGKLFK